MSGQNWRTPVNSEDYFTHQKKSADIETRRPTARRASDLVGPGINALALRLVNFSDVLATYNGYYSTAPGAIDAPNDTDAFVGYVVSDAEYGGFQSFVSMATGTEYRRLFRRYSGDAETMTWTVWSSL